MATLIAEPLRFEICRTCVNQQHWGRRDLCPAWTFELPCPKAPPAKQPTPVAKHDEQLICYVCEKRQFEGAYVCPDGEKCLRYPDAPPEPEVHICGGACIQNYSPNSPIEIRIDELTREDIVEFIFDSRYNAQPYMQEVNAGLDDTQRSFIKEMIAQTLDAFLEFFNEDERFMEWQAAKVEEMRRKNRERNARLQAPRPTP
jgi:hypothetical protein